MRFYYFIFYCLHSIIPRPKHIKDYRFIAGYLLTFLTVILVWTVYGLTIFQKPEEYSKPTFRTLSIISFVVFGLINYRISKSKNLFKTMIDQNKPTELKHKIWGWGLIVTTISSFATIVYLIRN
jgi:uncharacterized membrane protein YpjA